MLDTSKEHIDQTGHNETNYKKHVTRIYASFCGSRENSPGFASFLFDEHNIKLMNKLIQIINFYIYKHNVHVREKQEKCDGHCFYVK